MMRKTKTNCSRRWSAHADASGALQLNREQLLDMGFRPAIEKLLRALPLRETFGVVDAAYGTATGVLWAVEARLAYVLVLNYCLTPAWG